MSRQRWVGNDSTKWRFLDVERERDFRAILLMASVLLIYIVPVICGFSWNALGSAFNALDPPESYGELAQGTRVTVEAWGASVVSVPDHIKTRLYLSSGQLPLWNPYQGLGQPFAAMGEGSPYFPPAMLRSLAPYSWENGFLIVEIFISQCFLFYFLRLEGLGRVAAAFGGAAFALSGAVSFHLGRANILDQICFIPVLFFAMSYALSAKSVGSYVALAIVTALHVMAGFIQIAMTTQVLALAFAATMVRFEAESVAARLRKLTLIGLATVIGLGLSAFYLLPLLDWLTTGFGKNVPLLGFLDLPHANVVTFFFPVLFGAWFEPGWMQDVPRAFSAANWKPHWDNLYAVCGTGVLLISLSAIWGTKWKGARPAWFYFFFLVAGGFFVLRYANIAPASLANWLPVIGRQSPKHANALMAFCFIVAASAAVDNLRNIDLRKATIVCAGVLAYAASVTAGMFGTYVYSLYETGASAPRHALLKFVVYGGMTALIAAAVLVSVRKAIRLSASVPLAGALLLGVVCAELFLYVPLGRGRPPYILGQFLISAALFAGAYLLFYGRRPLGNFVLGSALAGYAAFVLMPWRDGLPRAYDLASPPTFMRWITANNTSFYRTFGIFPDYSVAAKIQDISVVGPLAPPPFKDFVWLISSERGYTEYARSGHFMLAGNWFFEADSYSRAKPILDWVGVKYLVLDQNRMLPSEQEKFRSSTDLHEVYRDDRVTVLASEGARAKAEYWPAVQVAEDQNAILQSMKRDPSEALARPSIEKVDAVRLRLPVQVTDTVAMRDAAVVSYGLDRVELRLPDRAQGGVVVLKDVYAPGWRAAVDGREAPIVRVNGLVRGVLVPPEGAGTIILTYLPGSFAVGLLISGLSIAFILCLFGLARSGYNAGSPPGRVVAVTAFTLSALVLVAASEAYLKVPGPLLPLGDIIASHL